MYQYYKGFIFREGTDGVPGAQLRELYAEVGWINPDMAVWMNEKFEIAMKNSAWAFTVWNGGELIGLVRVVSDKVMTANVQDLIVKSQYRKMGIGRKLMQLCIIKLPTGMWYCHTTPNNFKFYEDCGFTRPTEISEETLIFNGYFNSRDDRRRP